MRFTRKEVLAVSLVAAVSLAALASASRTCAPIWRYVEETGGAARWVRSTADWLSSTSAGIELEGLADELMKEYHETARALPEAEFSNRGRALPLERLPKKFRDRGGDFYDPQVFVRLDANAKPKVLAVSWGHLRQVILVFRKPPVDPPDGFRVRRVSRRTYVVADETDRNNCGGMDPRG
jgi:hypothetical protein